MSLNLADLYEAVSDAIPDRVALVCDGQRRTYAELDTRATQVGHQLQELGIRPGDHVGLHMRNSLEFVESLLGCLKARAVPININFRYTDAELSYLYGNAELVGVIVDGDLAATAAAVLPACPTVKHVLTLGPTDADLGAVTHVDYELGVSAQSAERDFGERSNDDHYVIYTGGTTGMPKGVVWRHEDFFHAALGGGNHYGDSYTSAAEVAAAAAAAETPMTFLVTAPLMHGAAVYSLFSGFFMASKQVLMRQFDAVEALRLVEAESVSCVMVVGDAIARPLADAIAAHAGEHDLSSLFMIGSGGALWSRTVQAQLTELLPNLYLRDSFGASESGADGTLAMGEDGSMRMAPSANAVVVDETLQPVEPGSGELGYLARRGHVPLAYYNDPAKTAATFPVVDGVRMSVLGDMARVEADGTIVLLGRGSGCINTGGEKVFPEEVEQALKSHPAVMDALVAGAPDPLYGERVGAVVQLREGFDEPSLEDVQKHCRTQIAGYKIPRSLVVAPFIVRSPSGKADYRWAKATVAEAGAEAAAPSTRG
ncbi:acyl-CoA synthetase [Rhodococcus sp. X156]|uniref:acyl-CoA synthetase n=1 Tax=Rhodococcus sp. X156 TaxID=2499145 RepID=UPI000FDBF4A0|nr:acyl-CoA synthetase [Rhodococcus sp. X156]